MTKQELEATVEALNSRVGKLEDKTTGNGLLSQDVIKRAFYVLGHNWLAIVLVYIVFLGFAVIAALIEFLF